MADLAETHLSERTLRKHAEAVGRCCLAVSERCPKPATHRIFWGNWGRERFACEEHFPQAVQAREESFERDSDRWGFEPKTTEGFFASIGRDPAEEGRVPDGTRIECPCIFEMCEAVAVVGEVSRD